MMASSLFKDYTFFVIPHNHSAALEFRKNIFKKNGAVVKNVLIASLNQETKPSIAIVINAEDQLKETVTSWRQKCGYIRIPFVNKDWASDCIAYSKILPLAPYKVDISEFNPKFSEETVNLIDCSEKYDKKKSKSKKTLETSADISESAILEVKNGSQKKATQDQSSIKDGSPSIEETVLSINALSGPHIDPTQENPNMKVIKVLSEMCKELEEVGLDFKANSYKKAIESLLTTKEPITSYVQAIDLTFVGKSLAKYIAEISETGALSILEILRNDPRHQITKKFLKVYGIGPKKANELYEDGVRTIDDLRKLEGFSEQTKLGLKYYEDWLARIPRDEATEHFRLVSTKLKEIDPGAEISIMGSYRRGHKTCGDIDFILTKKDATQEGLKYILQNLITALEETGYIECGLIGDGHSKFYGGGRLPGNNYCRRVDFLCVTSQHLGAAYIYFTGNKIFNRSIRNIAKQKGMVLTGTGLYWKDPYNKKQDYFSSEFLIEGENERKIFEILNVRWQKYWWI